MFKKKTDILLQTQSRIKRKDVQSLRQYLQYCFANYSQKVDEQLFGSSPTIDLLKFKTGICTYKEQNGPPLIIDLGKKQYFPTVCFSIVFALWRCNSVVPVIYTNSFVSGKILGGAALMAPGVIVPDEGFPNILRNTVVAIAVKGNPYPFAVGYCCVDNFTEAVNAGKGRVVTTVHCYTDCFYEEYASTMPLPDGFTPAAILPIATNNDSEAIEEDEGEESLEPSEKVADEFDVKTASATQEIMNEQEESKSENDTPTEPSEDTCDISKEEMDKQFIHLCIRCLNDVKETELPMQVSTFNSKYLQKSEYINRYLASSFYCGDVVYHDKLRWKFTSFQKLPKLIQHLSESNLIASKTVNNQLTILSINQNHTWLQDYRHYIETHKQEAVKITQTASQNTNAFDVSQQALFKVSKRLKPLFTFMDCDDTSLYTLSSARKVLNDYIQAQSLAVPDNPGFITIDPMLSDALLPANQSSNQYEAVTKSRKEVVSLFDAALTPFYSMEVNGKQVIKKGSCKKIEIVVQKIKGQRHFLTLVYNTSEFLLDTKDLVREFSKACAASCCEKTSTKESYIQIQGKVEQQVKDVLIKRFKVPTKFINIKK